MQTPRTFVGARVFLLSLVVSASLLAPSLRAQEAQRVEAQAAGAVATAVEAACVGSAVCIYAALAILTAWVAYDLSSDESTILGLVDEAVALFNANPVSFSAQFAAHPGYFLVTPQNVIDWGELIPPLLEGSFGTPGLTTSTTASGSWYGVGEYGVGTDTAVLGDTFGASGIPVQFTVPGDFDHATTVSGLQSIYFYWDLKHQSSNVNRGSVTAHFETDSWSGVNAAACESGASCASHYEYDSASQLYYSPSATGGVPSGMTSTQLFAATTLDAEWTVGNHYQCPGTYACAAAQKVWTHGLTVGLTYCHNAGCTGSPSTHTVYYPVILADAGLATGIPAVEGDRLTIPLFPDALVGAGSGSSVTDITGVPTAIINPAGGAASGTLTDNANAGWWSGLFGGVVAAVNAVSVQVGVLSSALSGLAELTPAAIGAAVWEASSAGLTDQMASWFVPSTGLQTRLDGQYQRWKNLPPFLAIAALGTALGSAAALATVDPSDLCWPVMLRDVELPFCIPIEPIETPLLLGKYLLDFYVLSLLVTWLVGWWRGFLTSE